MKILFVCQRNNGRSQIAKALYNKLTGTSDAESAGINVDNDGQTLSERAMVSGSELGKLIDIMKEREIDISNCRRTQLKYNHLKDYDKVIAILKDDEIPKALKKESNVTVWNIADPRTKYTAGLEDIINAIDVKVKKII